MKKLSEYNFKWLNNSIIYWLLWGINSIFITIFIQIIQYRSTYKTIMFVMQYPKYFFVNFIIVASTLAISFLFKRRLLVNFMMSLFWIAISIISTVMLAKRGLPLMFSDIFLVQEGLSLLGQYIDTSNLLPKIVFVFILIGFIYLISKVKKKRNKVDIILSITIIVTTLFSLYRIESKVLMEPELWDYAYSYDKYGFSYSIVNSMYPYLENKVEGYNKKNIERITKSLTINESDEFTNPNIIYVQLESFVDPLLLNAIELSIDPIPNFRELSEKNLSGNLSVPVFGGGTARTEFEILTSMNIDYMKPGEVPYNNVLRTKTIDSIATYLNLLQYSTTAIHNYEGNFYNRDSAMANMGFDIFIPLEYMIRREDTHNIDEINDAWLFEYIIKTLEYTDNQDFIYAISTGTHSPYTTDTYNSRHLIQVEGDITEDYRSALQSYLIRLYKLDKQIGKLVDYINELNEPTLLVLFSDHLPNLPMFLDENYFTGERFEAPYTIYSNFELNTSIEKNNLESYELATYVFDLLGLQGNIGNQIQREYYSNEFYSNIVQLMQYDILYGKSYAANMQNISSNTIMQFGINEIVIDSVNKSDEKIIVTGEGFTPESKIYVNGKLVPTRFVNNNKLRGVVNSENIEELVIYQAGRHGKILGKGVTYYSDIIE